MFSICLRQNKDLSVLVNCGMNFHGRLANYVPTCLSENKEAPVNFKGLSTDGERADFDKNLGASLFNKDLSNDTSFSPIHLDGQYL